MDWKTRCDPATPILTKSDPPGLKCACCNGLLPRYNPFTDRMQETYVSRFYQEAATGQSGRDGPTRHHQRDVNA